MNDRILKIKDDTQALGTRLVEHPLYANIKNMDHLQVFMEHHVFAVWDFMSLLKCLQRQLTCVDVPWVPRGNPETRYLINEIVIGEESDIDQNGTRISHFELYTAAMRQAGADTGPVMGFLDALSASGNIRATLQTGMVPDGARRFVSSTFDVVDSGKVHLQAAVFTFGREDLIPGMFMAFVKEWNANNGNPAGIFQYYLERHIEVDGEHHSHLAYQMTSELCGDSDALWNEATEAVKLALTNRLLLWDSINTLIKAR